MRCWVSVAALAVIAAGCGENEPRRLPAGGDPDAGGGGGVDAGPQPEMTVDPLEIDFGAMLLGLNAERVIAVRNTGEATLRFRAEVVSAGFDPAFSLTAVSATLAFGASRNVRVSFVPPDRAEHTSMISIVPDHPGLVPQQVALRGRGVEHCLTVEPTLLAFDGVSAGTTETRSLVLTNSCTEDQAVQIQYILNVRSCGVASTAAYCVRGWGGDMSLAGGQTVTLEVDFAPEFAGSRDSAQLRISDCPLPACVIDVQISGFGI